VRSRRSGRRAGSRWGTGCLSTAGRPVIQVVVGIIVEVREEASSAVAPVGETLVTGAPANEAAPEFSASRNVHAEAATAAESTDVAARMTSRHDSPCRIASGRECEESSEQEDRQATVSIPCGRHGHSMSSCRAIRQGGRDRRGPCHIETRVSVRLTMPNDNADASAACRHVGRPVDRSMPRVVPVMGAWCVRAPGGAPGRSPRPPSPVRGVVVEDVELDAGVAWAIA